jgi:Fe-S cluster assembly protein SufD
MSSLLTSLTEGGEQPDAPRRAALDSVRRGGLPGPRSERWKYTSLRALERRDFAAAAEVATPDAAELARIPAPRLVFVNGFHDASLSDLSGVPDGITLRPRSAGELQEKAPTDETGARGDDVFLQLNAALAKSGVRLHVAAGTVCDVPLHLVFSGVASTSDQAWHLHHSIDIGDAASLTIVEHHLGLGMHQHLANHALQVRLGANALLQHARVQHEADGASLIQRSDVVLEKHADYRRVDLELGAALSRHELHVSLSGERATLRSGGVLLANGRRHLDTQLDIRHVSRDTVCDLRWRGLATDRGRAVFHGGIVIETGADGSDARLSNKNLLLSPNAEIDAQPVLEIHADEVKAAHGATVGRLDETALFYLRSRGLPLADSRQLLIAAFCREPLSVLEDTTLVQQLTSIVDAKVGAFGAMA